MGDSTQIRTDLDVMGSVAGKFDSHYEQLAQELRTIAADGENVLQHFKGQAAGALATALDDVGGAWSNLNNVLTSIASKVQQSGVHYDTTDEGNKKQLAAVQSTDITSILSGIG